MYERSKDTRLLHRIRHHLRPDANQRANAASRLALVKMLPIRSVGCEIGVWKGNFSALLLKRLRPTVLHLVDPWAFDPDLPRAWYGGAAATSPTDMDDIYAAVCARFAKRAEHGGVRIHRSTSAVAAQQFRTAELDWVYIDGDHRYEAVRDELTHFQTIVRPGGYIAGDDYRPGEWYAGGVMRAVDEWAEAQSLTPAFFGSQFIVQLPPSA